MSQVTIYKNDPANSIFIEDSNGAQFVNSLQATNPSGDLISILDLARSIEIVSNYDFTDFVDNNGVTYEQLAINAGGSGTVSEVVNLLNTVFSSAGTPTGNLPVITSISSLSMVQGSTLNHTLEADFGVGYEWDSLPSGIVTVDGNIRKLIGGSTLAVGVYTFEAKAINYNGETTQTITLTVNTPPFSNTKSIEFFNQDYMGGNAALLDATLGRTGNGSGSSDAWTIDFYYKASTDNTGQTIIYFGSQDTTNNGYLEARQVNASGQKRIRFRYGSNNNYIQFLTPAGSLTPGTWQQVLISYDGGTTGSSSGSLSNYYSRFKIYINGSLQSTTNSHSNFGWSGSIVGQNFRFGRFASGSHIRGGKLDEINIWDSDQSGNISDIYNGGVVFDTMTLTDQPRHRWRFEDAYPNQQDTGTAANCVMIQYNMTAANNVNDVP